MDDLFGPEQATRWIAVPGVDDDKYARGVVGFVTGSSQYPGAAVLGVEAAAHAGVGMIRYLGPGRPTRLVLQRRPEAVTADGRALLKKRRRLWLKRWDSALADVPERDLEAAVEVMRRIAGVLDEL